MAIALGSAAKKLRLGSSAPSRIYAGSTAFWDADAAAYVAAVEAADTQPLELGVVAAYHNFVLGCKADGIWGAIKASCILAGARTLAGALVPLVGTAPTNVNFVSGDYNREGGLQGGSTKYLNSNRAGNADPQNNAHMSVYLPELPGADFAVPIGAGSYGEAGSTFLQAGAPPTPKDVLFFVRRANFDRNSVTNSFVGFVGQSRAAAGSYTGRANGVAYSYTAGSQTPVSRNIIALGNSFPSSISSYLNRVSFYSIGEGIDLAKLDARVTNLLDEIGTALAPRYADADVNAYITAVETADGGRILEPEVRDAINDFVVGCKSDGIWNAIKASCILCGARTLAGALVPLKGAAPTNNNFVSGDYNRETGLKGNGSTKSLNTNRQGNADPQNDFHLGGYTTTDTTFGGYVVAVGTGTGGSPAASRIGVGDTGFNNQANRSPPPTSYAFSAPIGAGFVGSSRTTSASFVIRGNGQNETFVDASGAPTSEDFHAFARTNGSNVAASHGNHRAAFYSIGEFLDLALLDTRVSALVTAIGAAI